jgi:membrane-bound lytic murein transglycosylase B
MPSSQRRFAVDFDADDRIDLRHSVSDAIGSVGRYLQQHGWQTGEPIAVPARVEPNTSVATGIKPEATLQELAEQGVYVIGDAQRFAALVDLVTPDAPTEYWAGFNNFYVITRYNRSSFYAMSVFQLAEALREKRSSH